MLRLLGIDERRLRLKWISASEGAAFAEEIRSFVQLLKELGGVEHLKLKIQSTLFNFLGMP
jgi:coenzyme F420-reducing hydrogenase delta subunit